MSSKCCPVCNSIKIIKKGKQIGRQRYQCKTCKHVWRRKRRSINLITKVWTDYADNDLTIMALRRKYSASEATIHSMLDKYHTVLPQATLQIDLAIRAITLDVTYVQGRDHQLLVAIESVTGNPLYAKRLDGVERVKDYEEAIVTLLPFLPNLQICVIDGRKGVREMLTKYGLLVQQCQFHQIALITQKLSRHPRTEAGVKLREISLAITRSSYDEIAEALTLWEKHFGFLLKEKTYYTDSSNKRRWHYTHRNLRSAFNSLKRNLPYLYVYQQYPEYKIPNTSNRIDGLFGIIKKHIRTHSGCNLDAKYKLWFYFLSIRTGVKKDQK